MEALTEFLNKLMRFLDILYFFAAMIVRLVDYVQN